MSTAAVQSTTIGPADFKLDDYRLPIASITTEGDFHVHNAVTEKEKVDHLLGSLVRRLDIAKFSFYNFISSLCESDNPVATINTVVGALSDFLKDSREVLSDQDDRAKIQLAITEINKLESSPTTPNAGGFKSFESALEALSFAQISIVELAKSMKNGSPFKTACENSFLFKHDCEYHRAQSFMLENPAVPVAAQVSFKSELKPLGEEARTLMGRLRAITGVDVSQYLIQRHLAYGRVFDPVLCVEGTSPFEQYNPDFARLPTVAIFGGSKLGSPENLAWHPLKEVHKQYEMFAHILAEKLVRHNISIATGAGPGVAMNDIQYAAQLAKSLCYPQSESLCLGVVARLSDEKPHPFADTYTPQIPIIHLRELAIAYSANIGCIALLGSVGTQAEIITEILRNYVAQRGSTLPALPLFLVDVEGHNFYDNLVGSVNMPYQTGLAKQNGHDGINRIYLPHESTPLNESLLKMHEAAETIIIGLSEFAQQNRQIVYSNMSRCSSVRPRG